MRCLCACRDSRARSWELLAQWLGKIRLELQQSRGLGRQARLYGDGRGSRGKAAMDLGRGFGSDAGRHQLRLQLQRRGHDHGGLHRQHRHLGSSFQSKLSVSRHGLQHNESC